MLLRGLGNMIKQSLRFSKSLLVSASFFLVRFASILPSNHLRKLALTCMGAKLGKNVVIYSGFEVRSPWNLVIGEGTTVGHNCILDCRGGITIGRNVNFSSEAAIWTAQHDPQSATFAIRVAAVVIEDRAWLSFRSTVLSWHHDPRGRCACRPRSGYQRYSGIRGSGRRPRKSNRAKKRKPHLSPSRLWLPPHDLTYPSSGVLTGHADAEPAEPGTSTSSPETGFRSRILDMSDCGIIKSASEISHRMSANDAPRRSSWIRSRNANP